MATYQAVSGTGKEAIEELAGQTAKLLNAQEIETQVYPKQIAFNALPHIDTFQENGYTREEMKMVWETKKILKMKERCQPYLCQNPGFYGHSEAVHIETRDKLTESEARELLSKASGVTLIDERADGGYPTAVTDAAGQDATLWVG